ncbi:MAG TPA: ATP-binding protein, partial [Thermomicrobiales bacterium]|nr:ATP-binding protein [Thermomicrobiales bacterium]
MRPIGEVLRGISIEKSTSAANTHTSSDGTTCPICSGAGFLRMDASVTSPNFSRLVPCVCKMEEQRARSQRNLREFSDLTPFRDQTFESFDPSQRGTRDAFEAAIAYARHPDGWLVLVGDYGCGKTHLAAAIASFTLDEREMGPIFAVVPDLLDYLRTTFSPDSDVSYDDRFNAFRGADLLILDDLGTENATPWAREKLFQIINHRYNERSPLVVTTNDLDRVDPRIRSRLCDRHLSR